MRDKPHALYRMYDDADRLLYVGISAGWPERLRQHARSSAWYSDVVRIALEHHPDEATARQAERLAQEHENPVHNIDLNGRALGRRSTRPPSHPPNNLRELRLAQGLPLVRVERDIAISAAHLSAMENRRAAITPGRCQQLARYYGVTADRVMSVDAESDAA